MKIWKSASPFCSNVDLQNNDLGSEYKSASMTGEPHRKDVKEDIGGTLKEQRRSQTEHSSYHFIPYRPYSLSCSKT